MKYKAVVTIFLLIPLLVFNSCAKRGTPDGGPIDETPPRFVSASPENYSTNFDSKEIRINFDEYIKLENAQNQIIISPPMDPRPEFTPLGTPNRSVRIRINDTLSENTTYAINFGRSIVDNNEGNPLPFFRYVFSTGSYIDSLEVSGAVSDAYLMQPDPFISVMLYEVDSTYSDSAIYNSNPRYITNTLDSLVTFQLENLKEGTYQMVAIQDQNNNYRYDPGTEKIGFLSDYISVPTDSVYHIELFRENLEFTTTRAGEQEAQHLIIGYEGQADLDSTAIQVMPPTPEGFTNRITRDRETDTLHFWYKPALERDSLQLLVTSPTHSDTLLTRLRSEERDSLQVTFEPTGTIGFDQEFQILPNIPIAETVDSLMMLFDQDTIAVPFTTRYEEFENRLIIDFEKQESQSYRFEALPGAIVDFFGQQNDTIQANLRTQAYSDFGTILLNLQNISQFPIIVQLTNEEGEPQAEQYSTGNTSFTFRHVPPGTYYLRLIYDTNENGEWDPGNFLEGRQPEEIIYYPEPVEARANWDDSYLFTL